MEQLFASFEKFGLGGILAWSGTVLLFFIVRWVLKTMDKLIDRSDEQQQRSMTVLNQHLESMNSFHAENRSAHEFQRKEHEGQIASLREIEKALIRMNGHKPD